MPFVELKLCEKIGKILIEAKKLYYEEVLLLLKKCFLKQKRQRLIPRQLAAWSLIIVC